MSGSDASTRSASLAIPSPELRVNVETVPTKIAAPADAEDSTLLDFVNATPPPFTRRVLRRISRRRTNGLRARGELRSDLQQDARPRAAARARGDLPRDDHRQAGT